MRTYTIKSIIICFVLLISLAIADTVLNLSMNLIGYTSIVFLTGVFVLTRYFVQFDDSINENKRIRRLMIGSMVRLFLVVIFLAISLFNMLEVELTFVFVYGLSFLFFLFFDILEMRTNLRPDSEKSIKN